MRVYFKNIYALKGKATLLEIVSEMKDVIQTIIVGVNSIKSDE